MVEIEIKYRPVKFIPWERHKKVMLPTNWDELTEKQFIFSMDLQSEILSESKILQVFLSVNRILAGRIVSLQRFSILRHLAFLKKPEAIEYFKIKRLPMLHAPESRLENVSLRAFISGDTYYQNYVEGQQDDLNRFIAHFYTGAIGFDEKLINIHVQLLRRTDIKTREAIAMNYGMIRQWLYITYPYSFRLINKIKKIVRSEYLIDVFEYIYKDKCLNDFDNELNKPLDNGFRLLESVGKWHFNDKNYNPFHKGMFLDPDQVKFPDVKILTPNSVMARDGKFLDPQDN